MRNYGLDEAQAGFPGEIPIISYTQMTPPLLQNVKKN